MLARRHGAMQGSMEWQVSYNAAWCCYNQCTVTCLLHARLFVFMQALEASVIDHNIKLILVDSIAALARSEFSRDRIVDRQQLLGEPSCTCLHVFHAFMPACLLTCLYGCLYVFHHFVDQSATHASKPFRHWSASLPGRNVSLSSPSCPYPRRLRQCRPCSLYIYFRQNICSLTRRLPGPHSSTEVLS